MTNGLTYRLFAGRLNLALLNLLHQYYKKVNSFSFGGMMPNLSVLLVQNIVN